MRLRLTEQNRIIKMEQNKWLEATPKGSKAMQRQNWEEYQLIKRQKLDRIWRIEKSQQEEKLKCNLPKLLTELRGLLLSDEELELKLGTPNI